MKSTIELANTYPGQPLVCAAAQILAFPSLDEATKVTSSGWIEAESNVDCPGAGGQNSKAAELMVQFREHRDIERLISDLNAAWRRTVDHQPDYAHLIEPGLEKSKAVEAFVRENIERFVDAKAA